MTPQFLSLVKNVWRLSHWWDHPSQSKAGICSQLTQEVNSVKSSTSLYTMQQQKSSGLPSHFIMCDARRWYKAFSGSSSGGVLLPALLLHLASEVPLFYHCLPTLVSTLCFYQDGGMSWCCTMETGCVSCSVVRGPRRHDQKLSSARCLCVSQTAREH